MRYNIFNQVHRPLKESLLSTCISLSTTDWNSTSTFDVIRTVEQALDICNEQVKYEAIHILPYIFEYEPSVWNSYTTEHHKLMNLYKDIESRVQSFYKLKQLRDRSTAIEMLCDAFNEFVMVNYNHMDDEEAVLNEILWRYYSDQFIIQMENELKTVISAPTRQSRKKALQMANAA